MGRRVSSQGRTDGAKESLAVGGGGVVMRKRSKVTSVLSPMETGDQQMSAEQNRTPSRRWGAAVIVSSEMKIFPFSLLSRSKQSRLEIVFGNKD